MLLVDYTEENSYSEPILRLIDENKDYYFKRSYFMNCLDFYCHLKILMNKYLGKNCTESEKFFLKEELSFLCQKYNIGIIPVITVKEKDKEEYIWEKLSVNVTISFVKSSSYIDEDTFMAILTFIENKINNLEKDDDKIFQLYLYQLVDSCARLELNSESGNMELVGNIKNFEASRIVEYLVDKESLIMNDLSDFHKMFKFH